MAGNIKNDVRDAVITLFRQTIADKYGVVPFLHQADWFAASDGLILLQEEVEGGVRVQYEDKSIHTHQTVARPYGRAKVLADLGSFKIGKSFGSALWIASFAAIPNARVQLIGLEYDICAPEFEYLCEFLLSSRGMGIKPESLQNRPRDGRMWLDLPNGARFEAKSWERKDTLKGKEIDCYLYCESYMLPGLECYTDFSQNLRARDGYAVFPTTPDRPWLQDIHNAAHSDDKRFVGWHCTCGVRAEANPYTFDLAAKERDKQLMTRDKFSIHYEGQLGDFVGRVYGYQRGQRIFTAQSHPHLFNASGVTARETLVVPPGWTIVGGADTGTFSSAVLVMFSPSGDAFVIEEFPNYYYTSGQFELDDMTIPEWCNKIASRASQLGMRPLSFYADQNSQFKREVPNYGLHIEPNRTPLETRTEIAREYFQHDLILLAPWVHVLSFEIENAKWPEESTSAGRFERIKDRDHTLDCLEHILSKRPRGRGIKQPTAGISWINEFVKMEPKTIIGGGIDPHLGIA